MRVVTTSYHQHRFRSFLRGKNTSRSPSERFWDHVGREIRCSAFPFAVFARDSYLLWNFSLVLRESKMVFLGGKYQGRIDEGGGGGSCIDALANVLHFWVLTRGSVGGRGSGTHASQNFPEKNREEE